MDRDGDVATDPRDPNYDSGDEQNGVAYHLQLSVQIKMYKQSVRARPRHILPYPKPCSSFHCVEAVLKHGGPIATSTARLLAGTLLAIVGCAAAAPVALSNAVGRHSHPLQDDS